MITTARVNVLTTVLVSLLCRSVFPFGFRGTIEPELLVFFGYLDLLIWFNFFINVN